MDDPAAPLYALPSLVADLVGRLVVDALPAAAVIALAVACFAVVGSLVGRFS